MEGKGNAAVKSNVKLLADTVKEVPKSGEMLHYVVQQSSKQINLIKSSNIKNCPIGSIVWQSMVGGKILSIGLSDQ